MSTVTASKKKTVKKAKAVAKPAQKQERKPTLAKGGFPAEVAKMLTRKEGASKIEIDRLAHSMGQPVPYKNLTKLLRKMDAMGYRTEAKVVIKDSGVKVKRYYAVLEARKTAKK